MAKTRRLTFVPSADQLYHTRLPNLLVAGCSYVWNNSEEHACTWPYYIQDIVGFSRVFDCSQSGGGPDNVFNSIVNELTINPEINPNNTMIIVMWPELSRTDVIATTDITKDYHAMSLYHFNDRFSNLSIFNYPDGDTLIDEVSRSYKKLVSMDAQEYQSLIKIIALSGFLKSKGYHHLFLSWKKFHTNMLERHGIDKNLINSALENICDLTTIDEYADSINEKIPGDGHPTPEAHISWAREYLAPFLHSCFPDEITIKGVESFPRGT